jgi:uncharacterized protein YjbJ (UPF0337 family)
MARGTGDKAEGKGDETKGKGEGSCRQGTGDRSTELEGKKDQVKGEGKQAWGDLKNAGHGYRVRLTAFVIGHRPSPDARVARASAPQPRGAVREQPG